MSNISVFVFLGLLCLAAINAAPTTAPQESSEDATPESFVDRLRQLAVSLDEFSVLYTKIAEKGPKVLTEVLKDPKVLEVKTDLMESETKIFKDYIDKFEKTQKENQKEHLFELIEEFIEIVNQYDSENYELSTEAAIIEKSLNENGLADIEKSAYEDFQKLLNKFTEEVEQSIKGLSEKEKKNEEQFINWFEDLKSEKDIDKKIDLFNNFMEAEDGQGN